MASVVLEPIYPMDFAFHVIGEIAHTKTIHQIIDLDQTLLIP